MVPKMVPFSGTHLHNSFFMVAPILGTFSGTHFGSKMNSKRVPFLNQNWCQIWFKHGFIFQQFFFKSQNVRTWRIDLMWLRGWLLGSSLDGKQARKQAARKQACGQATKQAGKHVSIHASR